MRWRCPLAGSVTALLLLIAAATAAPGAAPLTPAAVAARLQSRFEHLADYECLLRTESRADGKVEAGVFRLWFRRPGMVRLRVLKGRRQGSELVLQADGTLRGRRGGLLRPFSRRLDRADRSLRGLRGQPAWELDFGSFLRAQRERLALPGTTAVVHPATGVDPTVRLEVRYRPPGAASALRDVWTINPSEWLLTSADIFDGETRVDHVEFTEVRLNTGLKDDWFRF